MGGWRDSNSGLEKGERVCWTVTFRNSAICPPFNCFSERRFSWSNWHPSNLLCKPLFEASIINAPLVCLGWLFSPIYQKLLHLDFLTIVLSFKLIWSSIEAHRKPKLRNDLLLKSGFTPRWTDLLSPKRVKFGFWNLEFEAIATMVVEGVKYGQIIHYWFTYFELNVHNSERYR